MQFAFCLLGKLRNISNCCLLKTFPCTISVNIVGIGASFLALSASVMIVNEESTHRRSVIVGIASSGGATGNIVLPPFTSWCISMYGWRGCFILMGGLCLQGIVICALLYSGQNVVKPDHEKKGMMPIILFVFFFLLFLSIVLLANIKLR